MLTPTRPVPAKVPQLLSTCLLLLLALLAGGCQTAPKEEAATPPQRYDLHGKIVSLNQEHKIAAIDHQEIVGWMGAMTMEFPIKEESDWEKLHVGDEINATVFVGADGFYVAEVEVVTPATEGQAP